MPLRRCPIACWALTFALAWSATPSRGSDSPIKAAEELIERERLRSAVEQAFEVVHEPVDNGFITVQRFVDAAVGLAELGPPVAPFLINELEQNVPATFFFCAYALGLLGGADAEQALRVQIARAEKQPGEFAVTRKAWSGFGLALMGRVDSVELLNEGRHRAGHFPMHRDTTAIEVAAIQTSPASIPLLTELLDRYVDDASLSGERRFILRALARLSHPDVIPPLLKVLSSDTLPIMRREAAFALRSVEGPQVVDGLVAALDDEHPRVRMTAALALEAIRPADRLPLFLKKLESETEHIVREPLYRLVAQIGGKNESAILRGYLNRPDPLERAHLIRSLSKLGGSESMDAYRIALQDRDSRVSLTAIEALAQLATPEALDMVLRTAASAEWTLADPAIDELVRLQDPRAGGVIQKRLMSGPLAGVVTESRLHPQIEGMIDAMVDLSHTEVIADLIRERDRQIDSGLKSLLDGKISKLESIKRNGRDVGRWVESAGSAEREIRLLAYERLGKLGGEGAARALVAAFGRVEPDESVEILRALAGVDEPATRELVERVLGPEFDSAERLPLREMAAWAATRLGGEALGESVEAAVHRRKGRDFKLLCYLATLAGKEALPILAKYRVARMRLIQWSRGPEQEKLDRLMRVLRRGWSLEEFQAAPDRFRL